MQGSRKEGQREPWEGAGLYAKSCENLVGGVVSGGEGPLGSEVPRFCSGRVGVWWEAPRFAAFGNTWDSSQTPAATEQSSDTSSV